jgi:hypothetical protein
MVLRASGQSLQVNQHFIKKSLFRGANPGFLKKILSDRPTLWFKNGSPTSEISYPFLEVRRHTSLTSEIDATEDFFRVI